MEKTKYLEKHSNINSQNNLLRVVIAILTIGMVALGAMMLYMQVKVRTVIVPAYLDRKFYVEGDKASPEYLEMMTKYAIELVTNYTPETVKPRFEEFSRFISPSSYNTVSTGLMATVNDITTYQISQFFIPQNVRVVGDTASASGLLRTFAGDKPVSSGHAEYKLKFTINNGRFVINSYEKVEK